MLTITDENYQEIFKKHPFLLIKFTMTKCYYCNVQTQILNEGFLSIKKEYPNLELATMVNDITKPKNIRPFMRFVFNIHGYPTIGLLYNKEIYIMKQIGLKKINTIFRFITNSIHKRDIIKIHINPKIKKKKKFKQYFTDLSFYYLVESI